MKKKHLQLLILQILKLGVSVVSPYLSSGFSQEIFYSNTTIGGSSSDNKFLLIPPNSLFCRKQGLCSIKRAVNQLRGILKQCFRLAYNFHAATPSPSPSHSHYQRQTVLLIWSDVYFWYVSICQSNCIDHWTVQLRMLLWRLYSRHVGYLWPQKTLQTYGEFVYQPVGTLRMISDLRAP